MLSRQTELREFAWHCLYQYDLLAMHATLEFVPATSATTSTSCLTENPAMPAACCLFTHPVTLQLLCIVDLTRAFAICFVAFECCIGHYSS